MGNKDNSEKNKYSITVDHNPSQADNDALMEGLITSYEREMNETRDKEFSVFLKNNLGEIFGGIQARFDTESVYIDVLWVDDKFRKKGFGTKLLNAAELEAKKTAVFFRHWIPGIFKQSVFI